MTTNSHCNAVAVLHIDGDRLHPAIDLNTEQTLVAPESYPNSREATAAVEKVVAEIKAGVIAKLSAMGWTRKDAVQR